MRECKGKWIVLGMSVASIAVIASCTPPHEMPINGNKTPDIRGRVVRFFQENDANRLVVSVMVDQQGVMVDSLKPAIIAAVRNGTYPLRGVVPPLECTSFCAYVKVTVYGEIEALVVYLDPWGFSIGADPNLRIVNSDLAKWLEVVLRRNGFADNRYWPRYQLLLGKGAGYVSPLDELPYINGGPSTQGSDVRNTK